MAVVMGAVDRSDDFARAVEAARASGVVAHPRPRHHGAGDDGAKSSDQTAGGGAPGGADTPTGAEGKDSALLGRAVAEVSADLAATAVKLRELTSLVRNRSIFDDRSARANALTASIKQEVQALNKRLDQLQAFAERTQQSGSVGEQAKRHSAGMVGSLKVQFMTLSSKFKEVLKQRTSAMKALSDRRARYGEERTLGRPLVYKPPVAPSSASTATSVAATAPSGPSRGRPSHGMRQRKGGALPRPGGAAGAGGGLSTAEESSGGGGGVGNAFGQLEQSALAPRSYLETRASDVQDIESHIVDIGQIMSRLSTFVGQQGDMVGRVTDNIDDAADHTSAAEGELRKYLQSISSNKMLAFKVFLIIVTFIVFFVVFIA